MHTVDMGLQGALHSLLSDVGADVQVLQLGVAAVEVDHQGVLFHNALRVTEQSVNVHGSSHEHPKICMKEPCLFRLTSFSFSSASRVL